MLLHIAQPCKIIEHLPARPRIGSHQLPPLLQRPHLLQRQRIAFDGGGGVAIAGARVLLQRGNPGHLHCRTLNALPQGSYPFHQREQVRADRELRFVGHGGKSSVSQVMSQAAKVLR